MEQQIGQHASAWTPQGVHILPKGARVLTLDGTLPVEYLMPGDRVISRDSGAVTLGGRHSAVEQVNCVRLSAGCLGDRRPTCSSLMPAQTMIYLRRAGRITGGGDGAQDGPVTMAPAGRLLNGVSVRYAGRPRMMLIHLMFDAPHILYVDGMEIAPIAPRSAVTEPLAAPLANPLQ